MTEKKFKEDRSRSSLLRLIICVAIIAIGAAGFFTLKKMKKAPLQAVQKERSIKVETIIAAQEDVQVIIHGNGELKSVRTLEVAAEVSGRIVSMHNDLAVGNIIEKG
jgi:multidrug efflux pump subunit AcrA (membrane-fusion protein)